MLAPGWLAPLIKPSELTVPFCGSCEGNMPEAKQGPSPEQAADGSDTLSSPVFLTGENQAEYEQIFTQVMDAVAPRDILEKFWVEDTVYLFWEVRRLRRLKSNLLNSSARHGLKEVLEPLVRKTDEEDAVALVANYNSAEALVRAWYRREPEALKQVNDLLEKANLTMDAVMAQTLSVKLDDIQLIDRMIALAEARRTAALREVDRHREALARQLQLAARAIEDGEFAEVSETGE